MYAARGVFLVIILDAGEGLTLQPLVKNIHFKA